jgi:HEAT repeat protein
MKKGSRILLVLALIAFAALLGFFVLRPREPYAGGRPLSSWLKQLDDGDTQNGLAWSPWAPHRTEKQAQAADAIRLMGTNAVPNLLVALTNRDSSLKVKVLTLLAKQHWIKTPLPGTNHMHRAAALAFDVLGPAAKDAVPDLVRILKTSQPSSSDDPKNATIALAAIDPEGHEALIRLVSSNQWCGTCAIWGLASHHAAVPPDVIDLLITNVKSNPSGQGAISGWALGELKQDPERTIPALIQGFSSKDKGTRWGAAYGLKLWGTNATSAIPTLSEGLKDPDSTIRDYARNALKEIDPNAHYEKDRK